MRKKQSFTNPRPIIPADLERVIQRLDTALDIEPGIAALILGDLIDDLRKGEFAVILESYDFPKDFDADAAIRKVFNEERQLTGNPEDVLTTANVAAILGMPQPSARRWIACHSRRLKAWQTGDNGKGAWRVQRAAFDRARLQLGIAA